MSKRKQSRPDNSPKLQADVAINSTISLQTTAGVLLLTAIVLTAYFPALSGGFVLDDDVLLTKNALIKAPNGLYSFWLTIKPADYWPVSNTSLWIEWRLWIMNPTVYHITNLTLHVVASLLIWIILRKLSIPGAFLAAFVFAVHPVNVESVAWISQRKNLLSMLFFLLSILWYLRYIERARLRLAAKQIASADHCPPPTSSFIFHPSSWYWLSLSAFLLAMLSKGSVAVLPVLLLGIIWWQRPMGTVPIFVPKMGLSPYIRREIMRFAPFFLVAVSLACVNVWFQTHGTSGAIRTASAVQRVLGAGGVIWFYLYKALLPFDLAFIYPQWRIQADHFSWWLPLAAAIVITAILWRYRTGWSRPLLFAWGFFCVALTPVMGLTDVGFMKYSLVSDHYQYISLIGVIALAAAGWSVWREQSQGTVRIVAHVAAVLVVGILTLLTLRQSSLYRDAVTLYQATLEKNPRCAIAHNNLGDALFTAGKLREGIKHLKIALDIKPDYISEPDNPDNTPTGANQADKGINFYEWSPRLRSNYAKTHFRLGKALFDLGELQEGIEQYEYALRLRPNFIEAHTNLGYALFKAGRAEDAIKHFKQALLLNPNLAEAYNDLGNVLSSTGRAEDAIKQYRQAIRLKPDDPKTYANLSMAYDQTNQLPEAVAAAQKALDLARSKGQAAMVKDMQEQLTSYRKKLLHSDDAPNSEKPKSSSP